MNFFYKFAVKKDFKLFNPPFNKQIFLTNKIQIVRKIKFEIIAIFSFNYFFHIHHTAYSINIISHAIKFNVFFINGDLLWKIRFNIFFMQNYLGKDKQ